MRFADVQRSVFILGTCRCELELLATQLLYYVENQRPICLTKFAQNQIRAK